MCEKNYEMKEEMYHTFFVQVFNRPEDGIAELFGNVQKGSHVN